MPKKKQYMPQLENPVLELQAKYIFAQPDDQLGYFFKQGAKTLRARAKALTKKGERKAADDLHAFARKIDLLGRVLLKKR